MRPGMGSWLQARTKHSLDAPDGVMPSHHPMLLSTCFNILETIYTQFHPNETARSPCISSSSLSFARVCCQFFLDKCMLSNGFCPNFTLKIGVGDIELCVGPRAPDGMRAGWKLDLEERIDGPMGGSVLFASLGYGGPFWAVTFIPSPQ